MAVVWRAIATLSLVLAACGDRGGSALSGGTLMPTGTPIPWISAAASFAPAPTLTAEPMPTGLRACRAADLLAEHGGTQGAGGSWTGYLRLTPRGDRCLLHGLVELRFLDPQGQQIVTTTPSAPGAFRDWALLGEGQVQWILNNWCEPRVPVSVILLMLPGDPTPLAAHIDPPMTVGARCDSADGPKRAATLFVGPRPTPALAATQGPATIAARIDAPTTTVAGATLRYTVTLTNLTRGALVLDPCPSYLEWLGGHPLPTAAPPTNFPSFKVWDPIVRYGGGVKESHLLNCNAAPSIGPSASVTFEMRLAVPVDAVGTDTLRWQVIAEVGAPNASAPIMIVGR